ncbi:DNA polymerase alpha/epsilon subunit B, partial [Trinorchestia longiramus]
QVMELRRVLTSLGDTISQFPELMSNSRFILVPGPKDPGPCSVYPRPALPSYLTEGLRQKVPGVELMTNPCRLLYCTQEIVVFREDVLTKICRNCVYFPSDAQDIPSHFCKTLISQAHLAPLPPYVLPTYWDQDYCLSLHPTPDLVVIADRGDPFTTSNNGSIVTNPGSFLKTDFSFKVYFPKRHEVEDSQI